MADTLMIVSSKALYQALLAAEKADREVVFAFSQTGKGDPYVNINDACLGMAKERYEGFTAPPQKAGQLRRIVQQLEEQPITLIWTGEHFTIKDFVI